MIRFSIILGTISGVVLGCFLWFIEKLSNIKLYTLLMNVDFIPGVEGDLSPVLEWFFHIVIAWLIALLYLSLQRILSKRYHKPAALLLSITAAISYFPLTLIAKKETPSADDVIAITLWFIGHVIYGMVLYILAKRNLHHQ
ncbi:hypothetical protein [Gracilibacillus xinjiangensis]|uniref:DUF1440 domain-containing protein n=1 Tax=Gracilibacillus xinjiangensis TaxID=1193282 RepID=A0ABV8WW15_9BACI